MGVYGTSGTLDSYDIDADEEEEEDIYIPCANCEDEYLEEELFVMTEDNLYQEHVCEDCIAAYKEERQSYVDEAISAVEEMWNSGDIQKRTWR